MALTSTAAGCFFAQQKRKIHLPEYCQPPLTAHSSPTPGELHLVSEGGCETGITGFLLNPAGTLSSTQRPAASYSPLSPPCSPHPSQTEAMGAGPTTPPAFPWCQFSLHVSEALTNTSAVSRLHQVRSLGLWHLCVTSSLPKGAGS